MPILLVADDVMLAQTLSETLENEGMHIDEADRGEDALELADLYEYQVMILDLGLPDMRGDEVLLNLRQKNPNLPVLILSGEAEIEARLNCLQNGADDYLVKPFKKKSWSPACTRWCAAPMGTAPMCYNSAIYVST